MSLNQKRKIPYDFRVVQWGEEVILIDASSWTYPCSTRPHYEFESLYSLVPEPGGACHACSTGKVDGEEGDSMVCGSCGHEHDGTDYSEPGLILVSDICLEQSFSVLLPDEATQPDTPRAEAWDQAREEAQANHYI